MSKAMDEALKAVENMGTGNVIPVAFPPFERTGSYTADDLAALEANHLRLIEAAASAMAYVNPHLYVYGALKRAIAQAEEIRKKVGLK